MEERFTKNEKKVIASFIESTDEGFKITSRPFKTIRQITGFDKGYLYRLLTNLKERNVVFQPDGEGSKYALREEFKNKPLFFLLQNKIEELQDKNIRVFLNNIYLVGFDEKWSEYPEWKYLIQTLHESTHLWKRLQLVRQMLIIREFSEVWETFLKKNVHPAIKFLIWRDVYHKFNHLDPYENTSTVDLFFSQWSILLDEEMFLPLSRAGRQYELDRKIEELEKKLKNLKSMNIPTEEKEEREKKIQLQIDKILIEKARRTFTEKNKKLRRKALETAQKMVPSIFNSNDKIINWEKKEKKIRRIVVDYWDEYLQIISDYLEKHEEQKNLVEELYSQLVSCLQKMKESGVYVDLKQKSTRFLSVPRLYEDRFDKEFKEAHDDILNVKKKFMESIEKLKELKLEDMDLNEVLLDMQDRRNFREEWKYSWIKSRLIEELIRRPKFAIVSTPNLDYLRKEVIKTTKKEVGKKLGEVLEKISENNPALAFEFILDMFQLPLAIPIIGLNKEEIM